MLNIAHLLMARRDVPVDDLLELRRPHIRGERFGQPASPALDVCVVCGEAARTEFLTKHLASMIESWARVHERKGGHEARTMHTIVASITQLSLQYDRGTHSSPILRRGLKEYLLERLLKRASAGPKELKTITGWPRTRMLDTSPVSCGVPCVETAA